MADIEVLEAQKATDADYEKIARVQSQTIDLAQEGLELDTILSDMNLSDVVVKQIKEMVSEA
jgi:hypothetical protein